MRQLKCNVFIINWFIILNPNMVSRTKTDTVLLLPKSTDLKLNQIQTQIACNQTELNRIAKILIGFHFYKTKHIVKP